LASLSDLDWFIFSLRHDFIFETKPKKDSTVNPSPVKGHSGMVLEGEALVGLGPGPVKLQVVLGLYLVPYAGGRGATAESTWGLWESDDPGLFAESLLSLSVLFHFAEGLLLVLGRGGRGHGRNGGSIGSTGSIIVIILLLKWWLKWG
jgi:hypothetical protein